MSTHTMEDIEKGLDKVFICIFHDLQTDMYGLNISDRHVCINFLFEKKERPNFGIGGELTDEQIIAMRDFLTDIINEKELKRKPSH